jgi:hypothetical protein
VTKTLLISHLYPWPKYIGGNSRTFHFYSFFKETGSVDLAYFYKDIDAKKYTSLFKNEYILKRKEYPKGMLKRIGKLSQGIPYPLSTFTKEDHKKLIKLIKQKDYDYIIARYIKSVPGLDKLSKKYIQRVIVDLDDILSGSLYETFFDSRRGLIKRGKRYFNKVVLKRYERSCRRFGACLLCSEEDKKKVFGKNESSNIYVIPNIYNNSSFDEFPFSSGFQNRNNLLFIGALSYLPNVEGLKWFIKKIFPEIKKSYQDMKLSVVGHKPVEEIISICKNTNGIELFPDVPDVKEYYKKAFVVIVPLLNGGGTRIKILEAALAERVIFSTPKGAEGLSLDAKKEVFLFKNAKEFCEQYKDLLGKGKYNEVCKNAKNKVKSIYSWENFERKMKIVINSMNNGR